MSDDKKRIIPVVIDTDINEYISAFALEELYEEHELAYIRGHNVEARRFLCANCRKLVYLKSLPNPDSRDGHSYYFSHPNNVECSWRENAKNKAQIYAGAIEGKKHRDMKELLNVTLLELDEWKVIDVDNKFIFGADGTKRAKPDLHAQYKGENIAFEIQLRSESPKTITRRNEFYIELGWKLIWLSAENSDLVSDDFSLRCIKVKQVQKDIAFSNRGNWLIFNKVLSDQSIKDNVFTIEVKMWTVTKQLNQLSYGWTDEIITSADLQFSNGDTFYKDFHKIDRLMKDELREDGKALLIDKAPNWNVDNWEDFLSKAKFYWPSIDAELDHGWLHEQFVEYMELHELKLKAEFVEQIPSWHLNTWEDFLPRAESAWVSRNTELDHEWLHGEFIKDKQHRELTLKQNIVSKFRMRDDFQEVRKFWNSAAHKTKGVGFGIEADAQFRVVEKLLLILGYDLSDKMTRANKWPRQTTHYFHKFESFFPYQTLCVNALHSSQLSQDLLRDQKVQFDVVN